ncbi:MAG: FxsA family protein [Hyphomicrobiaceae bacterium]|nr:FxsA family protein [Hyphomicrobiaceae bacterium]
MTMVLLIVLIAVPLVEIAVMIKVGQWIGFWPAFGIVIGTFMLGASVLARSGLAAAFRLQEAVIKGEPPVAALVDGALLTLAGILLATPGFLADLVGLALLAPPLRAMIAGWVRRSLFAEAEVHVSRTSYTATSDPQSRANDGFGRDPGAGPVIEGEFERIDERPIDEGRHKGEAPSRRPREE